MTDHHIITGDVRTALRDVPPSSVHCCVTSPPYFQLRRYSDATGELGNERTPTEFVANLVMAFREVRRVMRKDAPLFLNLGDSVAKKDYPDCGVRKRETIGMPWLVVFGLRDDGWRLVGDYPWHKMNGKPSSVRDRFTPVHEYVFHMAPGLGHYHDKKAVEEPAKFAGQPRGGSTTRYNGSNQGMDRKVYNTRNKRSVLVVNCVPNPPGHEATFPPKLIESLILCGCPAGGRVLDPFAGSGRVAEVAARLGRLSLGVELKEEYAAAARERAAAAIREMKCQPLSGP